MVAAVGVVLTIVAFAVTWTGRSNDARAAFDTATDDAEALVLARAEEYASLLWDLRAYFGTTDFVTRADFRAFVEGESVDERFPGTQALGFSPVVERSDASDFEEAIRDDTSLVDDGYPDFEIATGGDHRTLLPVTYLEPLEGNERAFGFDLSGDEAGAEAVEAAVGSGEVTAGAPLLVGGDGRLLMTFLALYDGGGVPELEDERVDRFEGIVLGLFAVDEVMEGVLGDDPLVEVEIYDAGSASAAGTVPPSEQTVLFDGDGRLDAVDPGAAPSPNRKVLTTLGGRRWLLFFTPGPGYEPGSVVGPLVIAGLGLVLTALVTALILQSARAREQAAALALDMSGDLTLREQQLQRATEDIVRSNRDLERYATIAAHDLQEPLRSILAYSDLLDRKYKDTLDPEVADYIGRMGQAAERMRTLVTDLLAYARLETVDNRTGRVDLDTVFRAAVDDLAFLIEETGASVQASELPTVTGNERELIGVFSNLLSNALKYRDPSRPPVVRVDAERKGDEWLISVADNGIGIAPDYHLRIFELFRRLGPRDDSAGTGLGLAICARTVAQHGGRIWVESEEGQGATFYFTLPAWKPTKPQRAPAELT